MKKGKVRLKDMQYMKCSWLTQGLPLTRMPYKNVLQFLLISAHNQIHSNWLPRHNYYLPTLHGVGGYVLTRLSDQIKRKSIPTHETAPFFLYKPIKTATHSLHIYVIADLCHSCCLQGILLN